MSNPIMRRDRRAGWRFIAGFGAGLAVATVVLAGPLVLLSSAARLAPQPVRVGVLVALVALLAVADLLNRTPHVWRQVPQRFARELNDQPGRLGFIWAVDLGLMVTTQKTTSLLWIALAGAVLVGTPGLVLMTLVCASVLYGLVTAVLVVTGDGFLPEPQRITRIGGWGGAARRVAGAAGLGLAAVLAVNLW
ncbi:MAG TPA: hypothetical protein VF062_01470 [Candidatus Limnocylindrales bacterium]